MSNKNNMGWGLKSIADRFRKGIYTEDEVNASVGNLSSPLLHLPLIDSLDYERGSGEVTFTRASTATYIDRYGVLKYAEIDEPRFESDGLLIEGSSTNLVLYSEDSTNWDERATYVTFGGITTFAGIDLTRIYNSDEGIVSRFHQVTGISVTLDDMITASIVVKSDIAINCRIRFADSIGFIDDAIFDVSTGIINNPAGWGKTEYIGDGCYRVSAGITALRTDSALLVEFQVYDTNESQVFYAGAMQLEKLPFATSYIPTTDIAVTRAQDVCVVDYENNMEDAINSFSLLFDVNIPSYDLNWDKSRGIVGIVGELYRYARTTVGFEGVLQGTGLCVSTTYLPSSSFRFLYTQDSSVSIQYFNGIYKGTAGIGTVTGLGTGITLGETGHSASTKLFGHIKNFKVYDRVFTSQEAGIA